MPRFGVAGATLRFFLGDCVEVLGALPARSVDAIVTSPPYNLGIRYRTYDDTMPRDELPGVDRRVGRGGGAGAGARTARCS